MRVVAHKVEIQPFANYLITDDSNIDLSWSIQMAQSRKRCYSSALLVRHWCANTPTQRCFLYAHTLICLKSVMYESIFVAATYAGVM